jgi:hypothetical protein
MLARASDGQFTLGALNPLGLFDLGRLLATPPVE